MEGNLEFYDVIITSAIGLFGVILGVIVTSIVNWKIKSKEARLRILEKVFDERLRAHQDLLYTLKFMRTTISSEKLDEQNFIITYSALLADKKTFEKFIFKFYESLSFDSHWFDSDLHKEMVFAQTYFQNIQLMLNKIPDENYIKLAAILKKDLKNISESLEREALKFLQLDIEDMIAKPSKKSRTLSLKESDRRLMDTEFYRKNDEITGLTS